MAIPDLDDLWPEVWVLPDDFDMPDSRELRTLLEAQLLFLQLGRTQYDSGVHPVALQLAVAVRLLVHDTGMSRSLLAMVGLKDKLRYPLIETGSGDVLFDTGVTGVALGGDDAGYIPSPASRDSTGTFDQWWSGPCITTELGQTYTRADIIKTVANKLGGAHVDDLSARMRALHAENALGWGLLDVGGEIVPLDDTPLYVATRAIAEELERSIEEQIHGLGT